MLPSMVPIHSLETEGTYFSNKEFMKQYTQLHILNSSLVGHSYQNHGAATDRI